MKGKGYSNLRIQLSLTLHLSTREVLQKRPLQVRDKRLRPDSRQILRHQYGICRRGADILPLKCP